MTEEQIENQDNKENPLPKGDIGKIWQDFILFIKEILDITHDTDKKGTIQDVKDNISMKAHTAWLLVFSILIASIGLNVSSPAVVYRSHVNISFNGSYFRDWLIDCYK